jgi:hypothetical protein
MLADAVDSGEKSLCGSSTISWRSEGRWRRSEGAFYRRGAEKERAGIKGELKGEITAAVSSEGRNGWRREMTGSDRWDPASAR